jgi:hypothetical protein
MDQHHPDEPVCTQDDNCLVAGHPGGQHNLTQPGDWAINWRPCPASIWLLGAGAQCSLPAGHDTGPQPTMHRIVIEWSVR